MKPVKYLILILVSILSITLSIPQNVAVFAQLSISEEEYVEGFKSVIILSQHFIKLKNEIKEIEIMEYSETDFGVRITVSFTTSIPNQRLIFVGSKQYEILYVGLVTDGENEMEIVDLLESKKIMFSRTSLNTLQPDLNCSTYYCTKWQSDITWSPQPSCSPIIGQGCNPLLLIPKFGFVMLAICKAGVYVGCNFSTTRKCTEGFWNNVCPM